MALARPRRAGDILAHIPPNGGQAHWILLVNVVDSTIISGILGSLALLSVAGMVLLPWLCDRIIGSRVFSLTAGTTLLIPLFLFGAAAISFLLDSIWLGKLFLILTAASEPVSVSVLVVLGFVVLRKETKPLESEEKEQQK